MAEFLIPLILSLAYRIRGGLLGQWLGVKTGAPVVRALWATLVAACAYWLAPSIGLTGYLGVAAVSFLGASAGFPPCGMMPKSIEDVGGISQQTGWAFVGPLALLAAVANYNPLPLVLLAVAYGPAYRLAMVWQPKFKPMGWNPDGIPDPPAWAESIIGLGWGLAIVLTLRPG